MPEEIDIYRSANLLIEQHGEDAPIFAAQQADKCLAACTERNCFPYPGDPTPIQADFRTRGIRARASIRKRRDCRTQEPVECKPRKVGIQPLNGCFG